MMRRREIGCLGGLITRVILCRFEPYRRNKIKSKREVVYVIAKRNLNQKPLGRKGKNNVYVSGYTIENKPVLCNIFFQYEAKGVPLDLMIVQFYSSGFVIDWMQFIEDAKNIGWKSDTIIKRIQYAFDEIEIDDKDIIIEKIKKHI